MIHDSSANLIMVEFSIMLGLSGSGFQNFGVVGKNLSCFDCCGCLEGSHLT